MSSSHPPIEISDNLVVQSICKRKSRQFEQHSTIIVKNICQWVPAECKLKKGKKKKHEKRADFYYFYLRSERNCVVKIPEKNKYFTHLMDNRNDDCKKKPFLSLTPTFSQAMKWKIILYPHKLNLYLVWHFSYKWIQKAQHPYYFISLDILILL